MKNYKPSSELQRAAEESARNSDRLFRWAFRYMVLTGRYPDVTPRPHQAERHTNANIIKFPRRKAQIVGAQLPDGPEAA